MPEFDPELVEQAARVICHPHHHAIAAGRFACYLCEPRILAVLRVVADPLRAEGAKVLTDALTYYAERQTMENPKGWRHVIRVVESSIQHGIYSPEAAAPALATLALLADADTAYQRGKVDGAREVLTDAKAELAAMRPATDVNRLQLSRKHREDELERLVRRRTLNDVLELLAAREAVARIEKGGAVCGDYPAPCNHDPAHIEGGAR